MFTLNLVHKEKCGCGAPATKHGLLCDQCRSALANPQPELEQQHSFYDGFAQQHELAAKLNSLSMEEWTRFRIAGMPSRLLQ
jgi:hypothetical protein